MEGTPFITSVSALHKSMAQIVKEVIVLFSDFSHTRLDECSSHVDFRVSFMYELPKDKSYLKLPTCSTPPTFFQCYRDSVIESDSVIVYNMSGTYC